MVEVIEMLKPLLYLIVGALVLFGMIAFGLVVAVFIKVFKNWKGRNDE